MNKASDAGMWGPRVREIAGWASPWQWPGKIADVVDRQMAKMSPEEVVHLMFDPKALAEEANKPANQRKIAEILRKAKQAQQEQGGQSITGYLGGKLKEKGGYVWGDLSYKEKRKIIKALIEEKKQIKKAYNEVKNNPFVGGADDVLATITPEEKEIFNIHRGAIAKGDNGEIIVQNTPLKEATGHYGNYGLTKSIFKHGMSAKDFLKLPKIIRLYKPAEKHGEKSIYRTLDKNGKTYRQVWGVDKNKNKKLIPFFKEKKPKSNLSKKSRNYLQMRLIVPT